MMYRNEWACCGSVTETDAWEPDACPFCTPDAPAPVAQKITRDHVLSALAWCPTDMPHLKRCEWIANALNEATGQEGGAA